MGAHPQKQAMFWTKPVALRDQHQPLVPPRCHRETTAETAPAVSGHSPTTTTLWSWKNQPGQQQPAATTNEHQLTNSIASITEDISEICSPDLFLWNVGLQLYCKDGWRTSRLSKLDVLALMGPEAPRFISFHLEPMSRRSTKWSQVGSRNPMIVCSGRSPSWAGRQVEWHGLACTVYNTLSKPPAKFCVTQCDS